MNPSNKTHSKTARISRLSSKVVLLTVFSISIAAVAAVASQQKQLQTQNQLTNLPVILNNNKHTQTVQQRPKVEMVFALDTTGSMSGLIKAAKEKIWSIATTMSDAQIAPEISIGLVAYRDRGDTYITKKVDLSTNIDSVYSALLDFQADGGGDGPESVNAALYEAVHSMSWSTDPNSYKVIFLVGDAPGHNDYQNDVPYKTSLAHAIQKGIIVNTIQAGNDPKTQQAWNEIAALGYGDTFQVGQQGSAIAIVTPYDKKIASLSNDLDKTRVFYGDKNEKLKQAKSDRESKKLYAASSPASLARRAKYNLSESGKANFANKQELIQALEEKEVSLDSLSDELLPTEMQAMNIKEKQSYVDQKIELRKKSKKRLLELSAKRDAYISKELAKSKDSKNSLDTKLYATLKSQAAKKGLDYHNSDNSY